MGFSSEPSQGGTVLWFGMLHKRSLAIIPLYLSSGTRKTVANDPIPRVAHPLNRLGCIKVRSTGRTAGSPKPRFGGRAIPAPHGVPLEWHTREIFAKQTQICVYTKREA